MEVEVEELRANGSDHITLLRGRDGDWDKEESGKRRGMFEFVAQSHNEEPPMCVYIYTSYMY